MNNSSLTQALYDEFYFDEESEYDDFMLGIMNYFPIDKIDIMSGTYDPYLYDLQKTVADNYKNGNYQVSFFYSHLIFMSYVYYCVEKAYQLFPERMRDIYYPMNAYAGRRDKPDIENYASVYDFSKIPEKEIFKVFHIIGMEDDTIKRLSKYISDRDDFAHATGKGNISDETLAVDIKTIYTNMDALHSGFSSSLKKSYIALLLNLHDELYEYAIDVFYDFISDNSLSIKDLYYLCNLGISGIRDENELFKQKYCYVRKIHCAFIDYCVEIYGIDEPENFNAMKDTAYLYFKYENNAKQYINHELGINEYACVKDGGEFPLYECPDCDEDQLVYDAETEKYHCFHCGADFTTSDISFCSECGEIMRNNESCICDACFELKVDKD